MSDSGGGFGRRGVDPTLMSRPDDWVKLEAQFWIHTAEDEFLAPIRRYFPTEWTQPGSGVKAVWVSGYRIEGLVQKTFGRSATTIDVLGLRILLASRDVSWVETANMRPEATEDAGIQVIGEPSQGLLKRSNHVLLLIPVREDPSVDVDVDFYRSKIFVVLGLIRGLLGRNIAVDHLFDNTHMLEDGKTFVFPGAVDNPKWYGPPDISNQTLLRLRQAGSRIESLSEQLMNRVELSLRWFGQSFESTGVDAFIKLWIALETLAMERDARVRPVVECLAQAYGITYEQATQRFQVGRLQEIRHRIVHQGEQTSIATAVMLYLESIYLDVLDQKLNLANLRRAEKMLAGKASGVLTHLGVR